MGRQLSMPLVLLLVTASFVVAVQSPAWASTGPIPGDHVFDFTSSGDVVGEQPGSVSMPWQQADIAVVESTWAHDGRSLQISPYTAPGFVAAVFDDVPLSADVEIVMRFRDVGTTSTTHWMSGLGARIGGSPDAESALLTQTRDGTTGALIAAELTGGSWSKTDFDAAPQEFLRARWVGNAVSIRTWGGMTTDEPTMWNVENHLVASRSSSGGVGITRYFEGHTTEVDWVSVTVLETSPPTANIGPVDGHYVFDFKSSSDVIGEKPAYVSMPWQQADVSVVDSTWAHDGRSLQIAPYAASAYFAAVFDTVPSAYDLDVTMRFLDQGASSTSHWMTGLGLRVGGIAGTESGVLSQSRDGTEGLVTARLADGARASTAFGHATAEYLRTQVIGDTLRVKMWGGATTDEPIDWHAAYVLPEPDVGAGHVALTRYLAGHTSEVDWVSVTVLSTGAQGSAMKIMPVGDSMTAGSSSETVGTDPTYRYFLRRHLADSAADVDFVGQYDTHPSGEFLFQGGWDHDSFSRPGWLSTDVRDGIASEIQTHGGDVLLMFIGVNDLTWKGRSATETARYVETAISNARSANPEVDVLLALIPPGHSRYDETKITEYNALLRQLATNLTTAGSVIATVDMHTGWDRAAHTYDELHPTVAGEAFIARRWADALSSQLGVGAAWSGGDCVDDVREDDDTTATATDLGTGGSVDGLLCDGADYTKVTAGAGQDMTATLTQTAVAGDLDITLYAPDGTPLVATRGTATNHEELTWTATQSGAHYIGVSSPGGARNSYGLDIAVSNEAADTAPTLAIDSPAHGTTVSGSVNVQITASDAEDAAGTLIAEWQIDGGTWQPATWDSSTGTYAASWDSATVPDTDHALTARVRDSAGNQPTATSTFTVANAGGGDTGGGDGGDPVEMTDPCADTLIEHAGFTDVVESSLHRHSIDCVAWWGIAKGTSATTYAPSTSVSRAQMAAFVSRSIEAFVGPLPSGDDAFPDDDGSPHEAAINALAALDVVRGGTDGRYRPHAPVSRGQMATYLMGAWRAVTGTAATSTTDHFRDDDGNVHEPSINAAADLRIARGTGGTTYAPEGQVRRDQMASFLSGLLRDLVSREHHPTRL